MEAKTSLPINEDPAPSSNYNRPSNNRSSHRHRFLAALAVVLLVCYGLFNLKSLSHCSRRVLGHGNAQQHHTLAAAIDEGESSSPAEWSSSTPLGEEEEQEDSLVPFEAHIMSKCPDARDCLKEMVLPAMMQVIDKVNFTLSYIGTPTENDGVDCMHGPNECMGNILELCAAQLYPDPKIYLGFVMCLSREYAHIPQRELVEDCALEHAIDFSELNECAAKDDGAFGMALLRSSVAKSAKAKVTTSCTVRLDEEVYCVRDSGKWKDCPHGSSVNDLVIEVEKRHRRRSLSSS